MKAVIVEIRGNNAAALSDDGIVRQVKNRQYTVGQEIVIEVQSHWKVTLIRRCACAVAAVMLLSSMAWAYYTPYSYVSLDVNPSIEYSVNRFDRVLNCSAVNGDGADIVDGLQLKNKKIQDAVNETIQKIADAGYLNGKEADIIITAYSKSNQKSEALTGLLEKTVEEEANKDSLNMNLEAVEVGQKFVEQAKELGVTPGKLVLVNKLQESGSNLSDEEIKAWLDTPVKDLMKQIKENKKEEKASQSKPGKGNQGSTAAVNPADIGKSAWEKLNGNPAVINPAKNILNKPKGINIQK